MFRESRGRESGGGGGAVEAVPHQVGDGLAESPVGIASDSLNLFMQVSGQPTHSFEGLRDWTSLAEVHGAFFGQDASHAPPLHDVQQSTLDVIRELVGDGYFMLGVPDKHDPTGFTGWDLPLDVAIGKIEEAYVQNFDQQDWPFFVWLNLSDEGKRLARELYQADGP